MLSIILRVAVAIYYFNSNDNVLVIDNQMSLPLEKDANHLWKMIGNRDGYNTIARNIIVFGQIGQQPWKLPSIPPPLYPIFLAICYSIFGFNIFGFFLPHIVLDSINSLLVLFLGQRIFNNRIGIIASLFYALNPHFIISSVQLGTETLYLFLLLSLFLILQKLLLKPSKKYFIATGIIMALAALCRSVFLVFMPFIFIWLIIVFYSESRKALIFIPIIFLCFLLIYGVWVIRNYLVFHEILFSIDYSSAWNANRPGDSNEEFKYIHEYKSQKLAFFNLVKDNPRRYFNLCMARLKTFLFKPCVDGVSTRHKIVSSFIFFTIYPLGYLGLYQALREKNKMALLVLLFIIPTVILHVLTIVDGELRYRLPIELFILIFASSGLRAVLDFVKLKKRTKVYTTNQFYKQR